MNENESYLFHIEQPDLWQRAPDHFWIYGWFVSKNDTTYTDVRAFIDDVPFTGFLGLPRPDIEQAYAGWTKGRSPGFAFRLEPWVGAKTIRLEIQNRNSEWAEFWRVDIQITGTGECRRHQPVIHPRLIELLYLRLFKHQALHPDAPVAAQAKRMVQDFSIKCVDILPNPPFHGEFEKPEFIVHSQYNKISILGWIFHETRSIKRLLATTDSVNFNELVHGIAREDVAAEYGQFPHALKPRFQGIIDINQIAASPIPIKIFAEFEDGTRELVFARRVYQWTCLEKESRLPPYSRDYFHSVKNAILQGCRELNVQPGGLHFWRESRRLHRIFMEESQDPLPWFDWQKKSPYEVWVVNHQLRPRLKLELSHRAAALAEDQGPQFLLVVDARKIPAGRRLEILESLPSQLYSRWRALVVSREVQIPLPHEIAPQIDYLILGPTDDFAHAVNQQIAAASADWIMFPAASASLPPEGLLFLAEKAASDNFDLVFADEDHLEANGTRRDPLFKSCWSPELVLSATHPGECFALRTTKFQEIGGLKTHQADVLALSLALALRESLERTRTCHIPHVAYHRAWPPARYDAGAEYIERVNQTVNEALREGGLPGKAFHPAFAIREGRAVSQIAWDSTYLSEHHVTIVIPTRDRVDLLERCIEALLQTVNWAHVKLIIVDDFSREETAGRFLQCLADRRDFSCRVVRPVVDPMEPFNYSRLVNAALPYIDTPLILHLNNDVDALKPGWIEEMAGWFSINQVGAVGARLLYANDHINHAGVVVGLHHGLADVPLAGLGPHDPAPFELHRLARNCSAVTGACLMTRTDLYRELGGFDEAELSVAYNDIDYCLRLEAAGHRTVYTPQAELWHWGSASRGTAFHPQEHIAFAHRYPGIRDPYWSPYLQVKGPQVTVDPYRYAHAKRLGPLNLVAVSHNLNLEGAPLFLFEYIRFLVTNEGFHIDIVTAEDGPLREAYENMGANIVLLDRHPLHGARTDDEFAEQIEVMRHKLSQQIDLSAVDAFVCNTIACWWGVHLATAARKPSLLYVHESASIKRFFSTALPEKRQGVARAAFRLATRVCFLCKSTRGYYEELNDYNNFRYVSSWIDLERIGKLKAAVTPAGAREHLGLSPAERIIANIGTVCERKGQHMFLRTIDYFMKRFAGAGRYRFLIVGGRPGEYQDSLIADLNRLGLQDLVTIVNETDRVYEYFRAADLFVCTSFEESFPRVLLEAMAFETPIVSTNVHGIPEMVTDKAEAWLVSQGDPISFAKTMKTCLDKHLHGTSTTRMAYSKVMRGYDLNRVLPDHADLAREAVLDFDPSADHASPHRLSGRGDRFESSW